MSRLLLRSLRGSSTIPALIPSNLNRLYCHTSCIINTSSLLPFLQTTALFARGVCRLKAGVSSGGTNTGAGAVDGKAQNDATAKVDGGETGTTVPKEGEDNSISANQQSTNKNKPGAVPGLQINIVEANKVAADKDGIPPTAADSTRSENEDSFVDNDEEMDLDVDKPWVKPSLESAKTARKVW